MEEVPQGSNKTIIESVLIILTKSSKATQWPDEKNVRKNIIKSKNNENIRRRTPIVVLKPNKTVNKPTPVMYAAGKSPLPKTKNRADKTPPAQVKLQLGINKTVPIKSKFTINKTTVANPKTTVANPKTTVSKATPKFTIPRKTASQNILPIVASRKKRFMHRKASPDNTIIGDKIITKGTENTKIETHSDVELDNTYDDAKIYRLIEEFLDTAINTCSSSEKTDSNLQIDEEVAKKLIIKSDDVEENNENSQSNCPDMKDSSSKTVRKHIEYNISKASEKSQAKRAANAKYMAEVKIPKANIQNKKYTKNITKPIIIANNTNSIEHSKQKTRRKSAPLPKFVNRTDYLVQHIYNIQLDSHTLKAKKIELAKNFKKSCDFQKPHTFFETLSLILKNKNKIQTFNNYNNMVSKLQNLKKLPKTKQTKYK